MAINIDGKQYDETKLDDKCKNSVVQVSALQKRGFTVDRAKKIPQLDDIARGTRMNQGVFVGAGDDASDIAKMYGKGKRLRGTKFGSTLVDPFTGMAPRDAAHVLPSDFHVLQCVVQLDGLYSVTSVGPTPAMARDAGRGSRTRMGRT